MENFKSVPPADHTAKNQHHKGTARGFIEELKEKNDIMEVALSIGFKGKRSGGYFQGDCHDHGSASGKCLVIWQRIQGWKCYHCGKSGDVINLVMLFKKCDHKAAVRFLADRVGMTYWGGKTLTPAEIAQQEADMNEKLLVEAMLTKAAQWYHDQLKKPEYQAILDHLRDNHYGFSDAIIEELQIGFAPVSKKQDGTSALADYLNSFPEFRGKIHLTALFSFKSLSGRYYDYFKGRIVIPYWVGGKVVFMLARSTQFTPVDKYECNTDHDGNIKKDSQGNPDYKKYTKLRTYDPADPTKKQFSKFIQNDAFLGEDTIRGADEIIITEGAPDWISAVDKGFATISPATVNFRKEDYEKLVRLTQGAKSIYIINDNEENQAGYDGAIKTGKYLTEQGRNVFLVELPRPPELKKIDLNDYLKINPADSLRELMKDAKSVLEILIENLPDNYLKALPPLKEEIAPLLAEMDGGILQHYTTLLAKKINTTVKTITLEMEAAKKTKQEKESKKEDVKIDPEVEQGALALTMDPMVFRKRIDVVNQAGVVGERRIIAMYTCAIDSRLLPENFLNPNALATKNSGHFGSGKSYTLSMSAKLYPESAYHMMTNGSAKSLYYLPGGLKNKALIITEGFQFQENNAADSELVYVTRSLISEGRIRYFTVEKDKDGKLTTVEKKLDGPTSFITTTIMDKLEPQLEDRLFTIHPDEGIDQTKNIITMTADQRAGTFAGLDTKTVEIWQHYHSLLRPVEVVIPFAGDIAKFIIKSARVPVSTRRAFRRVLTVIQSVTCAYQFQRKNNEKGSLIAEMCDYWMALQIVREAFRENMGAPDKQTEKRLDIVKQKGRVTHKELVKEFSISSSGVTGWISSRVKEGLLVWCDENGNYFVDNDALKKAKNSGKAYIMVSTHYDSADISGLPSPYDLTGDKEWNVGGELYVKYDLQLDKKDIPAVCSSVHQAFTPLVNTPDDNNDDEIIDELDSDEGGVRVFGQNPENDDDNRWESDGDSEDDAGSWEYIDLK